MPTDRNDELPLPTLYPWQRAIIGAFMSGEPISIGGSSGRSAAGHMWNRYLWDLAVFNAAQGEPTYVA